MLLSKKIKIDVTKQEKEALEFMQNKCRGLYNWLLGQLRDGKRWNMYEAKKSLADSRQYDPELNAVYGKLLSEVYFHLDSSMQAFFRRVKAGEKAGFPRFRPRHQFFTLCYPAMYIKVEGRHVILPTGGKGQNKRFPNIIASLTEEPPPDFKEVAVTRDARGNYYLSFVYEKPMKAPQTGGVLAIDLGISTLAVGVNEQKRIYRIGGFKGYEWYNRQLDKIRSKRDRCIHKSQRYLHLSQVYKRVSERKRNKRKDSLHKASHLIAHKLAESAVVIGDLSQRQMVEKSDNRYKNRTVFNEWGLYLFVQMLAYKLVLAGKTLTTISERDTSKTCHQCQNKMEMPLWKRVYKCSVCGGVWDRDENSAINILNRYLARLGPHTPETVYGVLGSNQEI